MTAGEQVASEQRKQRTITMTGRPPVTINEDEWPVIARADDEQYAGQSRSQANRVSEWHMRVRRHADGRALVYATYSYETQWQDEECDGRKGGHLLAPTDDIVGAIQDLADEMADGKPGPEDQWAAMARECIADLPPEHI